LARSDSTSGAQARALFPSWPLPPAALRQHAQPLASPPTRGGGANDRAARRVQARSRRINPGKVKGTFAHLQPFSMKFRMSISCTARIDAVSCLFSLTSSTKYLLATNIPHPPSSLDLPPSGSEEAGLSSCATVGSSSMSFESILFVPWLCSMRRGDSPAPARSATRLCAHSYWRSPRMPWRSRVAAAYR